MKAYIAALAVIGLSGCSGLTQLQDSVSKFSQGVHTISTTQTAFFHAVKTADCSNQFFDHALASALDSNKAIDLKGDCTPSIIDDKQIKVRQLLMDSLTLYADKIQALATNDNNKKLDENSQNLATQINSLAKQGGLKNLSLASSVEAAVIAISDMVLEQVIFSDIKVAAKSMDSHLVQIVDALKQENSNFSKGIESKLDGIELKLRTGMASQLNKNATVAEKLFQVATAHDILQKADPHQADASQLNNALDSVVNSNHSIAHAGTGGILAAVNDLIQRAQAAQKVQEALSK